MRHGATATSVVLLTIAMAAVPTAAAQSAAAGPVVQEVGECSQPGEATFTLDLPEGNGAFQSQGACGNVVATFAATECDVTEDDRIWCDVEYDSGTRLNLTLGPDGGLAAIYASDSLWTFTGNLERADL